MNELTIKQQLFCDEYLINGFNGTKAYLSVYKNVKNENTAAVNASNLLRNPNISRYLEESKMIVAKKFNIDRDFIIKEYLEVLQSCKKEGNDGVGTIKDRANWTKALSGLSKLCGLDAPVKTDITSNGETIIFNINKPNK